MTALALQPTPDTTRQNAKPPSPTPQVLAQRASTFGAGWPVSAPAIVDAGRPLPGSTRSAMESSFGRDFGNMRVHDDARAHDDARSLGARAYTAGDHMVFGEGAYRPETPRGDALIAHELAHSVQQDGVQMKPDGTLPAAADGEFEHQADRAAYDVTSGRSVAGLGRIGRPAIFRANGDPPAAPDAKPVGAAGSTPDLPSDVEVIDEEPKGAGATRLVVSVPLFSLPSPKGKGNWVKEAYDAKVAGKALIFSPIFSGKTIEASDSIKAFMEKPGDKYKDFWLNNYGFTDLKGMGQAIEDAAIAKPEVKAITDKPGVAPILAGFKTNKLPPAHCDIDHIVEKQLGGASHPSNLQLLDSTKNQTAGSLTYTALVAEIKRILGPNRKQVQTFQIRFRGAEVKEDAEDGSFHIETLLRTKGAIVGATKVMEEGKGTPVQLVAGGTSEVIQARASGPTPIPASARRLISGMKFIEYRRGQGSGPTKGTDTVEAELASKPMVPGGKNISLTATIGKAPTTPDPSAGASLADKEAVKAGAGEVRNLELDKTKNADITFYYPYLSRGRLTKVDIDAQRNFVGEGVITPSVRFLGDLKFTFGPDRLDLLKDIDVAAVNSSAVMKPLAPVFRFKQGAVKLDLLKFRPSGTLEFTVGPASKPVIVGTLEATEEGGAFVLSGTMKPGTNIPGVTDGSGQVKYHSTTGWSGHLTASGTPFPKATMNAELDFTSNKEGGGFNARAKGGIKATIKGGDLSLDIKWRGGSIAYYGGGRIPKPLPLVRHVDLDGAYENGLLYLKGTAPIKSEKWKNIESTITVIYRSKDGEEGKFSGKADVKVEIGKATGTLNLAFKENGSFSGGGSITYEFTKDIKPTLGVEIVDERIKLFGKLVYAKPIIVMKPWPGEKPGKVDIFTVERTFHFQTPLPPVQALVELRASAFLLYQVGPASLVGLVFEGSLYPFEDDMHIAASVSGRFAVPGFVTLSGTFGAAIGLEVAYGALGATGGLDVSPSLTVRGAVEAPFSAGYSDGGFSFDATALATGKLEGAVAVELKAKLSALYGLLTHTWKWKVGDWHTDLGSLNVTLGSFHYGKDGEVSGKGKPEPVPKELDTFAAIKGMLGQGKEEELKPHQSIEDEKELRYHGHMI